MIFEGKNKEKKFSADDLFPIIIYIILNANAEHFYANIELIFFFYKYINFYYKFSIFISNKSFIQRYLNKKYLLGEYGYILTNVTAALSFLE